ncbi:ankyrin repeat and SOCS box protein 12 [Procambarus clarkii]|uniref:ankyrin repeat and SOCS box protein 12 n=1 Tax=Procambarus clarkii TaxID=6728 RepID=UPI0037449DB3
MANIVELPQQVSAQAYMMNHMVDAEDDEDVRLHLAALCGDGKGLKQITADPQYNQWLNYRVRPYMSPPLRLAVSGGNPDCVEVLVLAGADIELEDVKGQTPLFVATSQRKLEIMKILLEAGANPEGSRKNRCSPLLIAVRDGFSAGVKLLLQYGADPEPFDQVCTCVPGWPLQHAVVYAHFSCYFELVKGGAIANLTSLPYPVNPKTVARLSIPHAILKYAKEYPEFVELHYESGGDLRQLNTNGITCIEEFVEVSPARDQLVALSGLPLSLKSLCRVAIRKFLGRKSLFKLSLLEVPSSLITFLNFEEFTHYSRKSKENIHIKIHTKEE